MLALQCVHECTYAAHCLNVERWRALGNLGGMLLLMTKVFKCLIFTGKSGPGFSYVIGVPKCPYGGMPFEIQIPSQPIRHAS